MKILITGGAGVLGSSLCKELVSNGFKVSVLDVVRKEEAWRLFQCKSDIDYIWKSEVDIRTEDLRGVDIVFDCAIGFADRPFGNNSPVSTTLSNLLPSLGILELVRRSADKRPVIIYPSSFNSLYGHNLASLSETLLPLPTSLYGWTKGAVELLYQAYFRAFNVPVIITRTSSSFGPFGRSDELPHKFILSTIRKRKAFLLKSPEAKRLWTYVGDVSSFYLKLLERFENIGDSIIGKTLHLGGNKGEKILKNVDFVDRIKKIAKSDIEIVYGDYEEGELVNGIPISFSQDASWTRNLLGWQPNWELETALENTIEWFTANQERYPIF